MKKNKLFKRLLTLIREGYSVERDKFYISLLIIETNYYCNSRCVFCKRWKSPIKDFLTLEDYKNLFSELKGKVRGICFTGGEPLMRKDIFEIVKEAKKTGAFIDICTNGLLVPSLIHKIKSSGVDSVGISLESYIPEVHDELRGIKGAWKKAIEAITLLKKEGIFVTARTVITKNNIPQLPQTYSFVKNKLKVNYTAQPLHDAPINISNLLEVTNKEIKLSKKEKPLIEKTISLLEEESSGIDKIYYMLVKYFFLDPKKLLKIKCSIAGRFIFFIDPEGNVYPCESRRDWKLGNIKEQSFIEIYNSKKRKEFLAHLEKNPCVCMYRCTMPFNIRYSAFPYSFFLQFSNYLPHFIGKYLLKKVLKRLRL